MQCFQVVFVVVEEEESPQHALMPPASECLTLCFGRERRPEGVRGSPVLSCPAVQVVSEVNIHAVAFRFIQSRETECGLLQPSPAA